MIEIEVTAEFENRFKKLPENIRKKAIKQQELFSIDPFYPSLHTEKLKPKSKELWSIRVDRKYRIVFRYINKNNVLFLTIGSHDWIYSLI